MSLRRPYLPSKNELHLQQILDCIREVQQHLEGKDLGAYRSSRDSTLIVERLLQILTEAAIRLGKDAEILCPGIEWRSVRDLGNFLRHAYDHINPAIIWNATQNELPLLKASVEEALASLASLRPGGTRLGILLSGRGSNFLAIAESIRRGHLRGAQIAAVLSNREDAGGLAAARDLGFPALALPSKGLTRLEHDDAMIAQLQMAKIDLVCLAGYMRIVTPQFVAAFPERILNIHPSLLPSFPGLDAQRQALDFGAKVAGCTVHFVDEAVDHGVIILQRTVPVEDDDNPETLAARILAEEHRAYPEAIARVLSGDYIVRSRRYLRRPA